MNVSISLLVSSLFLLCPLRIWQYLQLSAVFIPPGGSLVPGPKITSIVAAFSEWHYLAHKKHTRFSPVNFGCVRHSQSCQLPLTQLSEKLACLLQLRFLRQQSRVSLMLQEHILSPFSRLIKVTLSWEKKEEASFIPSKCGGWTHSIAKSSAGLCSDQLVPMT